MREIMNKIRNFPEKLDYKEMTNLTRCVVLDSEIMLQVQGQTWVQGQVQFLIQVQFKMGLYPGFKLSSRVDKNINPVRGNLNLKT